jgi:hypothetical protein
MNGESSQDMAYVAEDPSQPGAAWAITLDVPSMREQNADEVAGWIRRGAIVRRVPCDEAKAMFLRWKSPEAPQMVLAM